MKTVYHVSCPPNDDEGICVRGTRNQAIAAYKKIFTTDGENECALSIWPEVKRNLVVNKIWFIELRHS